MESTTPEEKKRKRRTIWTPEENMRVAREFVRRYNYIRPTWGYICSAQQAVLPPERHKVCMLGDTLEEFRDLVNQVLNETPDQSTESIRGQESFPTVILAEKPIAETPEPVKLTPVGRPVLPPPLEEPELLDLLVDINKKLLALFNLPLVELRYAVHEPISAERINSLTQQAGNSIVLFERLISAARSA